MKVSVEKGKADIAWILESHRSGDILDKGKAVKTLQRWRTDPEYAAVSLEIGEALELVSVGKVSAAANWMVQVGKDGAYWLSGAREVGLSGFTRMVAVAAEILRFCGFKLERQSNGDLLFVYDAARRPEGLEDFTEYDAAYASRKKEGWTAPPAGWKSQAQLKAEAEAAAEAKKRK
jgi:hypothetical protein